MVRKMIAMVLLAVLALSMCSFAVAETKPYDFVIRPNDDYSVFAKDPAARAQKKDNAGRYYVTQTSSTIRSGAKVWYMPAFAGSTPKEGFATPISILSGGTEEVRRNARYGSGNAVGGRQYDLFARADADAGQNGRVKGRWTP